MKNLAVSFGKNFVAAWRGKGTPDRLMEIYRMIHKGTKSLRPG